MFTGIITEIGIVKSVHPLAGGVELSIAAPETAASLTEGASIAINGVCQTVIEVLPPVFRIQAVGTTLERTTLGSLRSGARINLETSLRLGSEVGGHLVTGHVDGTARVSAFQPSGEAWMLSLALPSELRKYVAARGSIAVDGTSLTVAAVEGETVSISVIPHTRTRTVAEWYRVGTLVNIEVDLLARYLERLLAAHLDSRTKGLTMEKLKEHFS